MKQPVLLIDLLKGLAIMRQTKWLEADCPFCYGSDPICDFHCLEDDGGGKEKTK